ncbi:MAG TPA: polysaccharide deacetylase family protein [Pyrinomonadaceae bacterium]|jgi:peptidoglycan/xylan/chitin deacetylase (PgdA/CDA1 family)
MIVIYYHNVVTTPLDEFDKRLSRIHLDDFILQMKYLKHHFKLISLETMLAQLGAGENDPGAMVVTFDDGYYGVMAHALPVMRSLDIPATVFLVTDFTRPREDFRLFHFDEIEIAFRLTEAPTLDLETEGEGIWPLSPLKDRVESMKQIKKRLKEIPDSERQRLQRLILEKLEITPERALEYARTEEKYHTMSWDDAREAKSAGLSFGSHTCTHRVLSRLDRNELEAELSRSFERIRAELDMDSVPFAYPYGEREHIGRGTPELVQQAGYSCALTTVMGKNSPPLDAFRLLRLPSEILRWFT